MSSPRQRDFKNKVINVYPEAKLRRRWGNYFRVFRTNNEWHIMDKDKLYSYPMIGWFRNDVKAWEYAWEEIKIELVERLAQ